MLNRLGPESPESFGRLNQVGTVIGFGLDPFKKACCDQGVDRLGCRTGGQADDGNEFFHRGTRIRALEKELDNRELGIIDTEVIFFQDPV